jgi:alkylation response protein AidB-like acyl-CoA dehydrogenase
MDRIEELAAEVATAARPHADRHDAEGSFVVEGVAAARESGYLAAPVPAELGGAGAGTAEMCEGQRVLGRACGSTALATSMHVHVVLAAAWRWRHGQTAAEPLLRRVADEGLIVASTGGNDWLVPSTVATPVDGGWRVNGRKAFTSLAPAAGAMATFAVVGEPADGAEVLAFGCPLTAPGVRVEETWDAVGMRGTGSHDIVLEDVFVAESQVVGRRAWGRLDGPLLLASLHAWPVVSAAYLGVAEGLATLVVDRTAARSGGAGDRPERDRLAGLLDAHLRTAGWALAGALADIGDDPEPTYPNFLTLQQMKRVVTLACREVATVAAELGGGGLYAHRGPADRMTRDLEAAQYHPYSPEHVLALAGRDRLEQAAVPVPA